MADLPEATRLYIGECMRCGGLTFYTAVWEQGEPFLDTSHDCTQCGLSFKITQLPAKFVGGVIKVQFGGTEKVVRVTPYTVTQNCTLEYIQ